MPHRLYRNSSFSDPLRTFCFRLFSASQGVGFEVYSRLEIKPILMLKRSFLYFITIVPLVFACSPSEKKADDGEALAKIYCGSCHLVPSPAKLDKNSWLTGVLPQMGLRLGVTSFQGTPYAHSPK